MNNYEFANTELNEETMQKMIAQLVIENANKQKEIEFLIKRNETWKKRYNELNEIALSNKALYEMSDTIVNEIVKFCNNAIKEKMCIDGKDILKILQKKEQE